MLKLICRLAYRDPVFPLLVLVCVACVASKAMVYVLGGLALLLIGAVMLASVVYWWLRLMVWLKSLARRAKS